LLGRGSPDVAEPAPPGGLRKRLGLEKKLRHTEYDYAVSVFDGVEVTEARPTKRILVFVTVEATAG